MLPKMTDSASEPQAFWPITFLNEDLKILGKILSNHINKYLSLLVHRGQVGFVPGRQAGDNVRKVIHLIHLLNHRKIPGFHLSLDIYKVFDFLSWDHLQWVLSRWGFEEAFLTWIKVLYTVPSVKYAGYFSAPSRFTGY